MIITIDYDKLKCKNAEAFNCKAGKTICSKCGFFEEQEPEKKEKEWQKLSTINTEGHSLLSPVRPVYATYADIDEIRKEMEEIRKMIEEMM